MKIPTILGLTLLITAISLGVIIQNQRQLYLAQKKQVFEPKQISLANISPTQATIIWQTDFPIDGSVIYGTNNPLLTNKQIDDRDTSSNNPKPRLSHFVTLKNLTPNTKYFYKLATKEFVSSDLPLELKTSSNISGDNPTYPKPIRGVILDSDLKTVEDAIVKINIPGAQDLATFTTNSGSFLIPLKDVLTSDLGNYFKLPETTSISGLLSIQKSDQLSEINISLPIKSSNLPPLTLGQNLNLKNFEATSSDNLTQNPPPEETSNTLTGDKFDLNEDGKVNSLDLAIVIQNLGKAPKDKRTDFDKNGIVDQRDVDIISRFLE